MSFKRAAFRQVQAWVPSGSRCEPPSTREEGSSGAYVQLCRTNAFEAEDFMEDDQAISGGWIEVLEIGTTMGSVADLTYSAVRPESSTGGRFRWKHNARGVGGSEKGHRGLAEIASSGPGASTLGCSHTCACTWACEGWQGGAKLGKLNRRAASISVSGERGIRHFW